MKYIALLIILIIATLSTLSCRLKKSTATRDATEAVNEQFCQPMVFQEDPFLPVASDLYDLVTAWIEDDCINLVVSYSGGCGTVDFQLHYDRQLMKSNPPQTSLFLAFADNDPCRAIVHDTLKFSLSPLNEYNFGDGLILNISGHEQNLLYQPTSY